MVVRRAPLNEREYVRPNVTSYDYTLELQRKQQDSQIEQRFLQESNRILDSDDRVSYGKMFFNKAISDVDNRYNSILENASKSFVGRIYMNALPLDESFKEENRDALLHALDEEFKKFQKPIHSVLSETSKRCLQVKYAYECILEKACKEKCNTDCEDTNVYDLDTDYEKADSDEISDVIKDKVIKVVDTEQQSKQKDDELLQDIVASKSVNEDVNLYKYNKLDEHTLFNSMMIGTYKQCLKESTGTSYVSKNENDELAVDMDMVLAESIIKYTILETFYTLKMVNLSARDVKDLSIEHAYM